MSYIVRPATAAERAEKVAPAWRGLLAVSMGRSKTREAVPPDPDARAQLVHLPGVEVARSWLRRALVEHVEQALETCTVLVADHPEAPGLALGWVAYDVAPGLLLALHVDAPRRGAWVGRTLLQHALRALPGDVRCALLTPAGRRLLGHVRAGEAVAA